MKTGNKTDIAPYIRQFYKGNIGFFLLVLLKTLFMTASAMLTSWLLQQIIDLIAGESVAFTLPQLVGLTALGVALLMIGCALAYFGEPRFRTKASSQYKNFVFSKISEKGISAFSGENTSTYISALSNDVISIENGYLTSIFTVIEQSMMFIAALILMFCYSPILTLISILFAILPILASLLTGGLLEKAEKEVSCKNESYMSTLRDALSGFSVVKSFRAERQMCSLYAEKVKGLDGAKKRRMKMAVIVSGCAGIAGCILQMGVFLVGAYLALSGSSISAGSVLVFVQLLNYVINPIASIPSALAECKASLALIGKVASLLETNVRSDGETEKRVLDDAITLKNLSFAYEPEKPILKGIDFRFEKGKSYCIVGGSGSGKSTLLSLLMASYKAPEGSIYYDDTELCEISSESLYGMVSMIQQNVFVFNASIRDNITMFSDFPREEVDRAIDLSGLRTLIDGRGEDYLCGENGNALSGGERQRISIARSLLKKSEILLVDEATAALDNETAFGVSSEILKLDGITRIVVTHALDENLLCRYDCILTMKNGQIAESGTFRELMDKKGYFYSLYTVSK